MPSYSAGGSNTGMIRELEGRLSCAEQTQAQHEELLQKLGDYTQRLHVLKDMNDRFDRLEAEVKGLKTEVEVRCDHSAVDG